MTARKFSSFGASPFLIISIGISIYNHEILYLVDWNIISALIGESVLKGRGVLARMKLWHGQVIIEKADGKALKFYKSLGFQRAGKTEPMWIYDGNDHWMGMF